VGCTDLVRVLCLDLEMEKVLPALEAGIRVVISAGRFVCLFGKLVLGSIFCTFNTVARVVVVWSGALRIWSSVGLVTVSCLEPFGSARVVLGVLCRAEWVFYSDWLSVA